MFITVENVSNRKLYIYILLSHYLMLWMARPCRWSQQYPAYVTLILFVFLSPVDHLKGEEELAEEKSILGEMLEVVEQRDWLVSLLEEQRLREREEDRDLEATILSKGFSLHWT